MKVVHGVEMLTVELLEGQVGERVGVGVFGGEGFEGLLVLVR